MKRKTREKKNKIVEFIFDWLCGNLTYNFNIQSANDYMISPLKSNESLPITINGSANTKQKYNQLNTVFIGNLINEKKKKNYNNLEMKNRGNNEAHETKVVTTLWMCVCGEK